MIAVKIEIVEVVILNTLAIYVDVGDGVSGGASEMKRRRTDQLFWLAYKGCQNAADDSGTKEQHSHEQKAAA